MPNFWVNGIVSHSDGQPKIQLSNEEGIFAQLSMGEARAVANNIMLMCARTEADALLVAFCRKMEFPDEGAMVLMREFRDFRAAIDDEVVETGYDKGPEEKS
jgi:hypothetical protein